MNAGTCFFPNEAKAVMGSWRADCMGISYSDSDAEDHGNSYSTSTPNEGGEGEDGADPAHVVSILATATGPVTISTSQTSEDHVTKTVVPVSATSSSSEVDSTTGSATTPAARTTASSAASTTSSSVPNDAGLSCQRSGLKLMTSVGLVLALAGILV